MNPGDRLRTAADRLRTLDKAATAGPWRVDDQHVRGLNCLLAKTVTLVASADDRRSRPNFDLIATLRPLAPVLVKQMRDAIVWWDETTETVGDTVWHHTEWCDTRIVVGGELPLLPDARCTCFDEALAIADAILAAPGSAA